MGRLYTEEECQARADANWQAGYEHGLRDCKNGAQSIEVLNARRHMPGIFDLLQEDMNRQWNLREAVRNAEQDFYECYNAILILAFYAEGQRLIDGLRIISEDMLGKLQPYTLAIGQYRKFIDQPEIDQYSESIVIQVNSRVEEIRIAIASAIVDNDEGEALRRLFLHKAPQLGDAVVWRARTNSFTLGLDKAVEDVLTRWAMIIHHKAQEPQNWRPKALELEKWIQEAIRRETENGRPAVLENLAWQMLRFERGDGGSRGKARNDREMGQQFRRIIEKGKSLLPKSGVP